MKKALYKTMYDKIQLNHTQKESIMLELKQYKNIQRKKRRLPAYAAACLCVLMLSNIVVFAAKQIHLGEWIATELGRFMDTEMNLSEEQLAIYDGQSVKLGQKFPLGHGTLTFGFMLCDNSYLYIPYTFSPDSEEYSYESIGLNFAIKGDGPDFLSQVARLEPTSQVNHKIHGSILLSGTFHQGDIIQVYKQDKDASFGKLICELPVGKIKNVQNVTFDAQEIKKKTDIEIEKITLSPLSIQITGNYNQLLLSDAIRIQIECKDGTIVAEAKNGSAGKGDSPKKGTYSFQFSQLFESPANLDELKGIRIRLAYKKGKECWIPL